MSNQQQEAERPAVPFERCTFCYVWSGVAPIPDIGDRVTVRLNGLGPGVVVAYGIAEGTDNHYLYVQVRLLDPPDWWLRQTKGMDNPRAEIFGAELESAQCDACNGVTFTWSPVKDSNQPSGHAQICPDCWQEGG